MPRILCDASIFVPAKGQMLSFDDGLESCQQRRPFGVNALRRSPAAAYAKNLMFYECQVFLRLRAWSGTLAQTRVDLPRFHLGFKVTITRPKGGKQSQPTGQVSEQFHIQFF